MTDAGDANGTRATIRQLDPATVDRIAAGEVVERPASVVKELVENSLDADATRIAIEIERGGTDRIRVADDGIGMSEAEVQVAVDRHTTSKIRTIDDLEAGVETLGFRGEALHTIAAVSRTRVTTKPRGDDGAGTTLRIEGGEVRGVEPVGCPEGTSIEVTDLFYNVPARRKFLGADATEFDHVNRIVTQYALCNPAVAISLEHNGREVFATPGRGNLQEAILSVYGREVAEGMIAIDVAVDDGPLRRISGAVSHPETTRASPHYVSTYVNGRYVTARPLRDAIVDAYGGQLAPDRYPFAVLFCEIPGDAVDVNVHPRKLEVRFDDERAVSRQVERTVRETLLEHGLVRSSAPRGRSAPDETTLSTEWTSDAETDGHTDAGDELADTGSGRETEAAGSSDDSTPAPRTGTASSSPADTVPVRDDGQSSVPADGRSTTSGADHTSASAVDHTSSQGTRSDYEGQRDDSREENRDDGGPTATGRIERGGRRIASRKFEQPVDQTSFGEPTEPEAFEKLPQMRLLGQLHETFLVAETDDGLVLVDQHAADERINYERLQAAFEGDTTTQALVEPVELELTAREASIFDAHYEALAHLGFTATLGADDRTVTVTRVPTVFEATLEPELLRDVLSTFVDSAAETTTIDATADSLLADLACYPSITGNTRLTDGSIVELLTALDDCENPYACPHGRPVVIRFDADEIADRFERDYPGHAGRRTD